MAEKCQDTLRCNPQDLQQAMSVHTRKITDSCRDKDCIEDLRVYLTKGSQCILDSCANVKVRCAELLFAAIDVEPVAFYRTPHQSQIGSEEPICASFSSRRSLCLCGATARQIPTYGA